MRKLAAITGLLGLGFISTVALAGSWSSFESAFPVSPCQDGWVGCIVEGDSVTPEMIRDSTGAPTPSDLRVGWFDLRGTGAFSPFPKLSKYTGSTDAVAMVDDEPDDGPVDDGPAVDDGPSDDGPQPVDDRVGGSDRPLTVTTPSGGNRGGTTDGGSPATGGNRGGTTTTPSGGDNAVTTPVTGGNRGGTTAGSTTNAVSIKDLGQGTPDAGDGGASSVIQKVPDTIPAEPGDCKNLKMLEPKAMLGKLSGDQQKCLEGELAAASKQTDKDKISRVLMTNAWSSGDKKTWEKLVKRHLDEIDRSDPDICYKYALHLAKKGPGASYGVIKWADVALENKTVWTGSTYTNRVYSLYKLRAAAAQKLWKSAEDKFAAEASDANRASRDTARNTTKVYAREWYEYAKSAGKNADSARALCISAAGTEDYCEGA